MTPDTRKALVDNPNVQLIETDQGGHCAFLSSKGAPDRSISAATSTIGDIGRDSRHWAEAILVRFLMATVGHAHGS
jgi:predicted alpha/beta-fold hydrolase